MGDNGKNIDDVENWLKNGLSNWLKKIGDINEIIVEKNGATFILKINNNEFNILQSEIDEIITIMTDVQNVLLDKVKVDSEFLQDILNYDKDSILLPIVSNNKEVILEEKKSNIKLVYNKSGDIFEATIQSIMSWRIIFLLVSLDYMNLTINCNKLNVEDEFVDIFEEFSYLLIDLKSKELDNVQKCDLAINAIYYFNNINSILLLPMGMCSSDTLSFFKIQVSDSEADTGSIEQCTRLAFNNYDSEALIYFMISKIHDDFRFVYLDLYHVLEYYFDRVSLASIRNIIKHGLEEPSIYFDDDEIHKLAARIKKIVIVDRGNYKETQTLSLLLNVLGIDSILKAIGTENDENFTLVLPKLKDNREELKELVILYNKTSGKYKINNNDLSSEKVLERIRDRIYSIRNAIAHSKEEFEWRLKPSSKEITLLKGKDLDLIEYCSSKIIQEFKNSDGF